MFTIHPITKQQIRNLTETLATHDTLVTEMTDGQYHIAGHGVTAEATFDEAGGSLAVTVVRKPFFVAESAIRSGIEEALD